MLQEQGGKNGLCRSDAGNVSGWICGNDFYLRYLTKLAKARYLLCSRLVIMGGNDYGGN
jgi:hypothetical protein